MALCWRCFFHGISFFGWEPPRYQTSSARIPGHVQMPKWKWSSCCVLCVLCGCSIFGRWSQHLSRSLLSMPGSTSLCPATHEPCSESVRVEGCTGWDGFDEGERQVERSFFKILSLRNSRSYCIFWSGTPPSAEMILYRIASLLSELFILISVSLPRSKD